MKRFLPSKKKQQQHDSSTQQEAPLSSCRGDNAALPVLHQPDLLPANMPPPPTGRPAEEELQTSITVPIIMGRETSLGVGLNTDNIVTSVRTSSAGDKAGIKVGDVVLGWQGRPLSGERLQDILRPAPVHVLSIARGSALGSGARDASTTAATPRATPRAVPSRHAALQQAPVQASIAPPEGEEGSPWAAQMGTRDARAPALERGGHSGSTDEPPEASAFWAAGWSEGASVTRGTNPKRAAHVDAAVGGSLDDEDVAGAGGVVRRTARGRGRSHDDDDDQDDDDEDDEEAAAAERAMAASMSRARAAQGYSACDMAEQMSGLLGGRGAGPSHPGAGPLHKALEMHGSAAAARCEASATDDFLGHRDFWEAPEESGALVGSYGHEGDMYGTYGEPIDAYGVRGGAEAAVGDDEEEEEEDAEEAERRAELMARLAQMQGAVAPHGDRAGSDRCNGGDAAATVHASARGQQTMPKDALARQRVKQQMSGQTTQLNRQHEDHVAHIRNLQRAAVSGARSGQPAELPERPPPRTGHVSAGGDGRGHFRGEGGGNGRSGQAHVPRAASPQLPYDVLRAAGGHNLAAPVSEDSGDSRYCTNDRATCHASLTQLPLVTRGR